jgi:WD40 repeat protein
MPLLFFSYSRGDRDRARELAVHIEHRSGHRVFVDIDAQTGILPSTSWRESLASNLRRAVAVVYLASERSDTSVWCASEVAIARFRGVPILAVPSTSTSPLPSHVDDLQAVRFVDDVELQAKAIVDALESIGITSRTGPEWDDSRPPYPGLDPFEEKDQRVFYGREDDRDAMLPAFDGLGPGGLVLAIEGASGSGKSSFVRAGLIPDLKRMGWRVGQPMEPGDDPEAQLSELLGNAPFSISGNLKEQLSQRAASRSLIVIDQAERLTALPPDRQDRFLGWLRLATHERGWWVLLVLRTEFTIPAEHTRRVLDLIDRHLALGPLGRERLRQAIVEPGRQAGIEFSEDVLTRMLDSTAGTDALPLLAYTLQYLYARSHVRGRLDCIITAAEYGDGVEGILAGQADAALSELPIELRDDALRTLAQLVSLRPYQPATGRPQRWLGLSDDERRILEPFQQRRIVTQRKVSSQDPSSAETNSEEFVVVTLSHESLVRMWGPLRDHIDNQRDTLEFAVGLGDACDRWAANGRIDSSYLLSGPRLTRAMAERADLPANLQEYITASREHERRRTRKRSAGYVLAGIGAIVAILALALLRQTRALSEANDTTDAHLLAEQALRLAEGPDADLARLAGVAAFDKRADSITEGALLDLLARPEGSSTLVAKVDGLRTAVIDRTGTVFLGTAEGLNVIEAGSNAPNAVPTTARIEVLAISSDGERLALGGSEVNVIDVSTRESLAHWALDDGAVSRLAVSGDGSRAAWSDHNGVTHVGDVGTGAELALPPSLPTGSWSLALSDDGGWLALGLTGEILLVEVETDRIVRAEAPDAVFALDFFTEDGATRLVSGGADDRVRIWTIDEQSTIRPDTELSAHGTDITSVDADGEGHIVTADGSGQAFVWTATGATWSPAEPIETASAVTAIRWVDAEHISVLGTDGSLHRIALSSAYPVYTKAIGEAGSAGSVIALHPHERTTATVSADGIELRLVGERTATIPAPGAVTALTFTPNGSQLVVGFADGRVELRSADDLRLVEQRVAHSDYVTALIATDDQLISAGHEGAIAVWDGDLQLVQRVDQLPTWPRSLAAAPDAAVLAAGMDSGQLQLWRLPNLDPVGPPIALSDSFIQTVIFTLDGRWVVIGGDDATIRIWPVDGGPPRLLPAIHSDAINGLGMLRGFDRPRLVSVGEDGLTILWDVESGVPLGSPINLGSQTIFTRLAVAPSGEGFVTLAGDRGGLAGSTIRWWDARPTHLVTEACTTPLPDRQRWESLGLDESPATICNRL